LLLEEILVATTRSQEETIELGLKLAQNLRGGEVLALHGDLGGGKTTFIKGLAEGLRINETITSPTFVILKKYDGWASGKRIELVHIDSYRADTIEDIKSVGIEDFLNRFDVILVVEWAEKIKAILPSEIIELDFKFLDDSTREITIRGINDFSA